MGVTRISCTSIPILEGEIWNSLDFSSKSAAQVSLGRPKFGQSLPLPGVTRNAHNVRGGPTEDNFQSQRQLETVFGDMMSC